MIWLLFRINVSKNNIDLHKSKNNEQDYRHAFFLFKRISFKAIEPFLKTQTEFCIYQLTLKLFGGDDLIQGIKDESMRNSLEMRFKDISFICLLLK